MPTRTKPLLVFVNTKSGPMLGHTLRRKFLRLLNPLQVRYSAGCAAVKIVTEEQNSGYSQQIILVTCVLHNLCCSFCIVTFVSMNAESVQRHSCGGYCVPCILSAAIRFFCAVPLLSMLQMLSKQSFAGCCDHPTYQTMSLQQEAWQVSSHIKSAS